MPKRAANSHWQTKEFKRRWLVMFLQGAIVRGYAALLAATLLVALRPLQVRPTGKATGIPTVSLLPHDLESPLPSDDPGEPRMHAAGAW
jgi:hypothetical protein